MKRSIGQWLEKLLKRCKKLQTSCPLRARLDFETLEDRTLPSLSVLSISGAVPASLITNATTVVYTVTFSAAATGVNPTDFQLVTTGTVGSVLTQVTPPSGSVYAVTISGISGNGTLGLNLVNNGTILDSSGGGLSNTSFIGQVYTINQVAPFVQSITCTNPAGPNTSATSVVFTVTFSEAVAGVNLSDFQLSLGGTAAGTMSQVTPVSASVYTVTVSGITGNGTLGLNLVDNGSIRDLAGNPLTQQNAPAAFQAPKTFASGNLPVSVAIGDVNGDGISDLVVGNTGSGTVSVLLGNGNGTFKAQQSFAAGYDWAGMVALGDVNGDGKADLVVAHCSNVGNTWGDTVSVLLGNGNGTFQAQQTFATGSGPDDPVLGDVNGDGKPDIIVANIASNTVSVLLGNGNGTFQAQKTFATGSGPRSPVLADLTGNGVADIVVANAITDTVSVLLGNGNGTFQAQQTYATGVDPDSVAIGDVNGDGKPDLVVANAGFVTNDAGSSRGEVSVLLGNGNGTFQAQQTYATGPVGADSVAIGDVNGDGKPDIVVKYDPNSTVSVLLGNGNGTFLAPQTFATGSLPGTGPVALGDVNGDGRPDLLVANYNTNTVSVLLGNGNGTFTTGQVYTVTPDTATHFAISAPASTVAGYAIVVEVTALDSLGNIVSGYSGTVHITSTDPQTFLPADVTLTGGIGFFAIILQTAGTTSLTAKDTATPAIMGSTTIIVSAAAASHFAVSAPATAVTDTAFLITVTAEDAFNNIATTYQGTLQITSTDHAAAVPAGATLTGGVGVFSATLKTPGTQTITVTDTTTSSIAGTSNNIATLGLVVTSLTPTPSGFVAVFDKPFDPNTINLYDTAAALGPDDVLLTGPGVFQTSIHGSLIIDPTDTTITFVKTSTFANPLNSFNPQTGVLTAGTYTVTFRSAANGFKDLLGEPLDGTASGNPAGSNYTTTFVVNTTPAEVVGIPGFARGPGNTVDLPNNQAGGIPISLSTGANVIAGKFTLQYNSALLSITGATVNSGLTGATLTLAPSSTPGNAVIFFNSPTALPAGPIRLGGLVATVPNAAASLYKSKALLHFSSAQLNGGAIAVTPDDAIELVAYLGDTNGDGQISSGDAALISRVVAGLDNNPATGEVAGFSAYPNADPVLVADMSTSGNINATDVTLINSYLAGTARAQIPPIPGGLTIVTTGPDPSLSLGRADLSPLYGTPGSTVIVPVNIDTARPDGSTGMTEAILALRYDPLAFTVSSADIALGTLPGAGNGWRLTAAVNPQTGEIGIDLFSTNAIQTTSAGSLVTVALHVLGNAPPGLAPLSLVSEVNPTWQRDYLTTVSDPQGAFVLHYGASTALFIAAEGQPALGQGPPQGAFANTLEFSTLSVNNLRPHDAVTDRAFSSPGALGQPGLFADSESSPSSTVSADGDVHLLPVAWQATEEWQPLDGILEQMLQPDGPASDYVLQAIDGDFLQGIAAREESL